MNAFSTYKDLTTIDFEHMIEHGLYLISGPTGSGKTTIFDAISFALYGNASGENRNSSNFRSDYADVKDETYVELVFELNNKVYTVRRSPTYIREGYKTPKMANAYLSYDEHIIEGVKEVNEYIKNLLGIDHHQFKQVVMIAQGEFTKLIYASSEEREKVLRHIFHSESLVKLENLLKEKTKEYKDDYAISIQKLNSLFLLLSLSQEFMNTHQEGFHPQFIDDAQKENESIFEQYQKDQNEYEQKKNEYDLFYQELMLKKQKNQDYEECTRLKNELKLYEDKKQYYQKIHNDIEKIKLIERNQSIIYQHKQLKENLHKTKLKIDELTYKKESIYQELLDIKNEYELLDFYSQQKEQCMIQIEKTKQALNKQNIYNEIVSKYNEVSLNLKKTQENYQTLQNQYDKLSKRIERDQENVNQLPSLKLQLQQDEQKVKDINNRRVLIHELSDLYDEYKNAQEKHYELSSIYRNKDDHYQKIYAQYQTEDENFKRQQAGILALQLKENEPCPVCGSTHHPHLAKVSQDVLSTQELELLLQKVEECKKDKEDAYHNVFDQNEHLNIIKTQINSLKKQLDITQELSKETFIQLLSEIFEVTQDHENNYQKRYEQVIYLNKIEKSLKRDKEDFMTFTHQLEQQQHIIDDYEKTLLMYETKKNQLLEEHIFLEQDLKTVLNEQLKQCQEYQDKIQYINKMYNDIHQRYELTNKQIILMTKQYEDDLQTFNIKEKEYKEFISVSFKNNDEFMEYYNLLDDLPQKESLYQNYIVKTKTLSSRIYELEDQLKEYVYVDLTKENEKLVELDHYKEDLSKKKNQLYQVYMKNNEVLKKLTRTYSSHQDLLQKYTMYQDLSDMASGKNGQRMSFERYVLSSYFEHILQYANIELLKMTGGRFEMKRKTQTKGSKQQGLDLSVLDYETGVLRDIQTLSGGESFKAALSLALGLSSMIQSYAGGIELNTLFIDEGFGSLDNESIDKALSVLLDMKNDNKVIGIISHVDELKERIGTKIIVEKGKHGSSLHIEND